VIGPDQPGRAAENEVRPDPRLPLIDDLSPLLIDPFDLEQAKNRPIDRGGKPNRLKSNGLVELSPSVLLLAGGSCGHDIGRVQGTVAFPPDHLRPIAGTGTVAGRASVNRGGRKLTLTDAGRLAYQYADEIFSLGRDFVDAIKGKNASTAVEVGIGVNDVLPKPIAYRLIEPVFQLSGPVRVKCVQGTPLQLLPPLSVQ
jgi:hypothetical protein